jgi:hypothetical protein
MKILFCWLICLVYFTPDLGAQDNSGCKVLMSSLQGTYEGGCKNDLAQGKGTAKGTDTYTGNFRNGLPHGKGVYFSANGEVYDGQWTNGLRDGEGTVTLKINGRDSVQTGIWKENIYTGPKPDMPKVIHKVNVVSATFTRMGEGNRISISFYQNGMVNMIDNLVITPSNGTEQTAGRMHAFYDLQFPFFCKINYTTWNSLRTVSYDCILEFEIQQQGAWDLRITN